MEVIVLLLFSTLIWQADANQNVVDKMEQLRNTTHIYRWEARAAYCRHEMKFCKLTPEETCMVQFLECQKAALYEWCKKTGSRSKACQ